jgi:hypothetical protein
MGRFAVASVLFATLCGRVDAQTGGSMTLPTGWVLAHASEVKAVSDAAQPEGAPKAGFTLSAKVTLPQPCYDLKIVRVPSTIDRSRSRTLPTYAIAQHRTATVCAEMITVKPASQHFAVPPPLPSVIAVRSAQYAPPKPAQVVPVTTP